MTAPDTNSPTPNAPSETLRQILLEVLTFGYDTGQGRDDPRGFNINSAAEALEIVVGELVEAEWQKRSKPLLENHDRLVRRLEELEAEYGK